ncbi:MAG: glutamine synthetase, partial [archaeon]
MGLLNLAEVLAFAKKNELGLVDLKFTDLPGAWHHFTVPISQLSESAAKEGLGFDGSSIRGFQEIHESDMLLVPDLRTAIKDPFSSATLSLT